MRGMRSWARQPYGERASAFNVRRAQMLYCGFRAHRRVIDLFERVRPRFGADDGQYLDVPVIVVLNGLPETQRLRRMQTVGRSVQHEVEVLAHGAYALQGAAQDRG